MPKPHIKLTCRSRSSEKVPFFQCTAACTRAGMQKTQTKPPAEPTNLRMTEMGMPASATVEEIVASVSEKSSTGIQPGYGFL